jgi:hypothetical protein
MRQRRWQDNPCCRRQSRHLDIIVRWLIHVPGPHRTRRMARVFAQDPHARLRHLLEGHVGVFMSLLLSRWQ